MEFKKRNPKYENEVDSWEDLTFLDKAKITIKGKITRTALVLLGKDESEHFINPFVAKIRWNLKTLSNEDKDYEIFSMPFILTVDEVYRKIRNLKYRYLREGTLFPDEVLRYEPFNIRESLHNAIAHQDYTKGARINVVEYEDDHLIFSNYGSFIPVTIENVVLKDSPEEFYRNPFLVEAMKNLDMIETQGGGIRKIFNYQRARFFPMPDYNFDQGKVKITITGKVLNEEFARILILNPSLSLQDIILLDKVQKRKNIKEWKMRHLRKLKLIEGRKPDFYLSKTAIIPTDNPELRAEYLRNKGLNDVFLKKYLLDYLKMGKAKRGKIDAFVWDKLSNLLDEQKKKNKIKNLLQELRKEGKVRSPEYGVWEVI